MRLARHNGGQNRSLNCNYPTESGRNGMCKQSAWPERRLVEHALPAFHTSTISPYYCSHTFVNALNGTSQPPIPFRDLQKLNPSQLHHARELSSSSPVVSAQPAQDKENSPPQQSPTTSTDPSTLKYFPGSRLRSSPPAVAHGSYVPASTVSAF
ncbi:hypothetical protein HGRIS_001132 [Hohenbuehelia grisea]|uniref:Uncharacterized protein n=1 Tax=Hohenbuehelia grisea TaxID=104357 RepID=A0ABR3JNY5_9AGAR